MVFLPEQKLLQPARRRGPESHTMRIFPGNRLSTDPQPTDSGRLKLEWNLDYAAISC